MFVWKMWSSVKYDRLTRGYAVKYIAHYKMLSLFGIIPLLICIDRV